MAGAPTQPNIMFHTTEVPDANLRTQTDGQSMVVRTHGNTGGRLISKSVAINIVKRFAGC